jgi:hypothetical protein
MDSKFLKKYDDYLSTTMLAKEQGLDSKEFISFLEESKIIYRDEKSLRLTQEAISLGGTYKISEKGKWIIWPKNALLYLINQFNSLLNQDYKIDILNNYGIDSFYHMTHIENLQSILEKGLFPHSNQYQKKDISDLDVNNRRSRLEPIYNKSIHEYVPFYFNPRNAMLYVRRNIQNEVVILVLRKELILKNKSIFTDGNASCTTTKFYNKIENLNKLDWTCLNDSNWNEHEDGRRKRMAEVLVPNYVSVDNIEAIICNNSYTKTYIENILKKVNLDKEIFVNIEKKLYF